MRVASFNVENLFERASALVPSDWSKGRPALEAYAWINRLLNKLVYTPDDKTEIVQLLRKLGLNKKDDGGKYAHLRQNRRLVLRMSPAFIRLSAPAAARSGRLRALPRCRLALSCLAIARPR
jgi:hypothetical protein